MPPASTDPRAACCFPLPAPSSPLAPHSGCLTHEQSDLLAELWRVFFAACEVEPAASAPAFEPSVYAKQHAQHTAHAGPHPRAHNIPSDDHAKRELRRLEEATEMRAFLKLYGGPQLRQIFYTGIVRGDHPDAVMLRFLRSRKWEVQAAVNQIGSVARFRVEAKLDALMRGGEPQLARTKGAAALMQKGVCYIWGATPRGEPIYWLEVARHLSANQTQHELHQLVVYYQEWLSLLMVPPVERKLIVFNLTGFGLRNMDWWCIFAIVKTIERYYPETVSHFLVWNPPWIFKPIWYILKPLLDPVVRDKVVIISDLAEMSAYIPLHRIPAETIEGGLSPWKYVWPRPPKAEDIPAPDRLQEQQKTDEYFTAVQAFEDAMRTWLLSRSRAKAQHAGRDNPPHAISSDISASFQLHGHMPHSGVDTEKMQRAHSLSTMDSGPDSMLDPPARAQSMSAHALAVKRDEDPIVQGARALCDQTTRRMRLHWIELLPHLIGGNMWATWGVTKLDGSVTWTYPLTAGRDAKEEAERVSLGSTPVPGGSVMDVTRTEEQEVQVLGGSSALPALLVEMDALEQERTRRRAERAPTLFRTVATALQPAPELQDLSAAANSPSGSAASATRLSASKETFCRVESDEATDAAPPAPSQSEISEDVNAFTPTAPPAGACGPMLTPAPGQAGRATPRYAEALCFDPLPSLPSTTEAEVEPDRSFTGS